jgi:HEAT repeat protein
MQSGTLEKLVNSAIRCRTEDAARIRVVQIYKHDPKRVVELATDLIGSNREMRRHLGVWLLAELGYPKKPLLQKRVALLKSVCSRDASTKVRSRAVLSLGQLGCESATKIILLLSRNNSAVIRLAVAQALPNDGSARTVAALRRLADDSDACVREWATFSFGTQSAATPAVSKLCTKVLEAKLRDRSKRVRLEAIRSLIVRGEFSSLKKLRREIQGHTTTPKFFDRWFSATFQACDECSFDDLLTGCFEELILSLDPRAKPLVIWS